MNYQVYSPIPELQSLVKCFWTLEDDGLEKPVTQRIVPDGCMEMIFHYGDQYRQYFEDGSSILQPRSFVFGQITRYIEIAPTGNTGLIAARFFPDGLIPFLQFPVTSLENKAVALIDLFGAKGKRLEEEVLAASSTTARIQTIGAFLLSQLTDPQTINIITKNCLDIIFQTNGQLDVTELAGKMKISRRNMERKFAAVIGMSPKQLSKAVRLQATLRMLDRKNSGSLTSLAYENGYYDQAHFIKDFKEFTGISPKSFYAGNLELAALFASGD